MLRYWAVAAVLVAWAGTGCSDGDAPRRPVGEPAATRTRPSAEADTPAPEGVAGGKSSGAREAAGREPGAGGPGQVKSEPSAEAALDPSVAATIEPLLAAMASEAGIERQAAAEALDAMGTRAVPYITAALRTGSDAVKRGAAAYLIGRVTLQDEAAVEALIGALGAADDVLRHNALQAIERLPDQHIGRAAAALAALAQDAQEDPAYRVRAVRAIAKLGAAGRDKMPELRELARDETVPEVQRSAIDAVGKVGAPEEAESFLLEVLKHSPQKDLRMLAARRLIQAVQSPNGVAGLIAAFGDPDADVRNEAIKSLVAIGRPAVPELIKALDDPDVHIRRRAVVTLGKLNTLAVDAVPDLEKKLQDADPEVRKLAAASLKVIRGQ